MYIQNYQIHNVLNVYQKQLTNGIEGTSQKQGSKAHVNLQLNYKSNRQTVMAKVASSVLEKINLMETESRQTDEFGNTLQNRFKKNNVIDNKKNKEFYFNLIDQNNQKIASSISIDNSESFLNHLDELAINGSQKE